MIVDSGIEQSGQLYSSRVVASGIVDSGCTVGAFAGPVVLPRVGPPVSLRPTMCPESCSEQRASQKCR